MLSNIRGILQATPVDMFTSQYTYGTNSDDCLKYLDSAAVRFFSAVSPWILIFEDGFGDFSLCVKFAAW